MWFHKSKALLIIFLCCCLGCQENRMSSKEFRPSTHASNTSEIPQGWVSETTEIETPQDIKLIKTGEVRYQVDNVQESTRRIKNVVQKSGGYIANVRFENNQYSLENRFTIKVPQQGFDKLLDSINNNVKFIDYETINTRDVTEEYVDVEARLKTKMEVKARYETILRKQAKTVAEILKAEEMIGKFQAEIESAQGKLQYLQNRVAYSTIVVELYEKVAYVEQPTSYEKSFWAETKEGFSGGLSLVTNLLIGIVHVWPFILAGTLVFLLIRRRKKKKINILKN
jgi:hypothetical protein